MRPAVEWAAALALVAWALGISGVMATLGAVTFWAGVVVSLGGGQ